MDPSEGRRGRLPSGQRGQLPNGCSTKITICSLINGRSSFFLEKRTGREKRGEDMKWLWKMIFPARRVLGGVASRINFRQSGLLKLRSDVRACEYEDVRVMWEMLKRNETELVGSDGSRKRQMWSFLECASSAPCLGRRF